MTRVVCSDHARERITERIGRQTLSAAIIRRRVLDYQALHGVQRGCEYRLKVRLWGSLWPVVIKRREGKRGDIVIVTILPRNEQHEQRLSTNPQLAKLAALLAES